MVLLLTTPVDPVVTSRAASELVDAIVEAVDIGRTAEVERLRVALGSVGLADAFDAELRLSGLVSCSDWISCDYSELML